MIPCGVDWWVLLWVKQGCYTSGSFKKNSLYMFLEIEAMQ
jgi:hypothetical protein